MASKVSAVIPGSYTVLVTLGIVIGLMVQARLLALEHVDVGRVLMVSLVAVAMGLVGAKLWYLALDRQSWRKSLTEGWCVQGFLAGAALMATQRPWSRSTSLSGACWMPPLPGCSSALRSASWDASSLAVVLDDLPDRAGACGLRIAGSEPAASPPSYWSQPPPSSLALRPCS